MSVTLRLLRLGKKNHPVYRIVAIDKRKKRNGLYKEQVGFYDPMLQPHLLKIDDKKFNFWQEKGALISEGLQKLLKKYNLPKKD